MSVYVVRVGSSLRREIRALAMCPKLTPWTLLTHSDTRPRVMNVLQSSRFTSPECYMEISGRAPPANANAQNPTCVPGFFLAPEQGRPWRASVVNFRISRLSRFIIKRHDAWSWHENFQSDNVLSWIIARRHVVRLTRLVYTDNLYTSITPTL